MWRVEVGSDRVGLAFTPDGRHLLATGRHGIAAWRVGEPGGRQLLASPAAVDLQESHLTPDGGRLYVAGFDQDKEELGLAGYTLAATPDGGLSCAFEGEVASFWLSYPFAFAAAWREVYCWLPDRLPRRFGLPAAAGEEIGNRPGSAEPFAGVASGPTAFDPGATRLLMPAAPADPRTAAVWDTLRDREAYSVTLPGEPRSAALADSGHAAFGLDRGRVQFVAPDGSPLACVRASVNGVSQVLFAPAGPLLATYGRGEGVALWHRDTGERVAGYDWKVGPVRAAAFAPDALTMAVAGPRRSSAVVFDLEV